LALALAGCSAPVRHGLSETDALQVKAALEDVGLTVGIEAEGGRDGKWKVSVPEAEVSAAIRTLRDQHLPHQTAPGLGEVFGSGNVVPTPTEERAQLVRGLSGEVARMLESLDGVVQAKVIAMPAQPSPFGAPEPGRASVFLKVRSVAQTALEARRTEIQALVAGAVPGLNPASVSVLIDAVVAVQRPVIVEKKDRSTAAIVGVFSALLLAMVAAALGVVTLKNRKLRLQLEAQHDAEPEPEPRPAKAPAPPARKVA
jgi:type III secretion protein J